jgi:3-deoxy-manno-octulosonate cytidylyltransferase (CMP-KDO synthetase)
VEHHGEIPQHNVVAIIPARFASTRLPGKMLADVVGKPLIVRTLEQARKARSLSRVIVATDDERIAEAVRAAGGDVVITSTRHESGSDRAAEVARDLPEGTIVVNIQGDEPLIDPDAVDRAVSALVNDPDAHIATIVEPMSSVWRELLNFDVVKAVVGENGNALYFSRSPMPFPRSAAERYDGDPNRALESEPELWTHYRKHSGVYVYRREYLLEFTQLPQTRLEKLEKLEQLRALENGAIIKVVDSTSRSIGVDTQDDLDRVRAIFMLPDIEIRRATIDDLPRVAAVHVESWQRSFSGIAPEEFLRSMDLEKRTKRLRERFDRQPYGMFLAEHSNGQIAGFIDYGDPVLKVDHDVQVYSFYLLPQFQRLGLGERLFRHCVHDIRDGGFKRLCLDSLEASPYKRFYSKMGGSVIGHDKHKLGDEDFATVIYGWNDLEAI